MVFGCNLSWGGSLIRMLLHTEISIGCDGLAGAVVQIQTWEAGRCRLHVQRGAGKPHRIPELPYGCGRQHSHTSVFNKKTEKRDSMASTKTLPGSGLCHICLDITDPTSLISWRFLDVQLGRPVPLAKAYTQGKGEFQWIVPCTAVCRHYHGLVKPLLQKSFPF